MKKYIYAILIGISALLSKSVFSQCAVTSTASSYDILCGDTVRLNAQGNGVTVFKNDFNGCNIGTGWEATSSATFADPCNKSKNGTCYLWMGSSADVPRTATTNGVDLSTGGSICFFMRYGAQGDASPCEGIEKPNEGVTLQYSVAGGPWTTIAYYSPNGGNDPVRTNWNEYCEAIPPGAQFPNTRIRWIQMNSDGIQNDHWGLEDVKIEVNPPGAIYTWAHTGASLPTGNTPAVVPIASTTYNVTYKFGANCTVNSSVTVIVRKQTVSAATVPNTPICPGDSVLLTSTNTFSPVPIGCGPSLTGCLGNTATINIGTGNVAAGYTLLGAGGTGGTCLNDAGTPDRSIRTQFIIRASEIPAFFKGGQIYNLSLDLSTAGTGLSNFTIKMGCTSDSIFASTTAWKTGLTEVYTPKGVTFTTGLNLFDFDKHYDWDGKSNIVIQICAFGDGGSGAVAKSTAKLANSVLFAKTCRSNAGCEINVNQVRSANQPNIVLGVCYRPDPVITYTWTPTNGLASSSTQNTKTAPNVTTTYTVTVRDLNTPVGCAVSATTTVTVAPVGSVKAAYTPICSSGTLSLTATLASPLAGVNYAWTGPGGFISNVQNPTRNPAVAGRYYVTASNGNCSGKDSVDVVLDTPPNPGVPTDTKLCSNGSILDLFGQLAGEDGGGTWKDDNNSGGLSGGNLNPKLIAAAKLPGTFSFTYELNTNSCGLKKSTVKVTVEKLPVAGINASTAVCNSGGTVNLFPLLGAAAQNTGVWTDLDASGKMTGTDPNRMVNPTGLTNASYRYQYKVSGISPCPDSIATITMNVSKQANSGTATAGKVCIDATLDLNTLLSGQDAGGTWAKVGHSEGDPIAGSNFKATNATPGTYTFEYTVKGTAPCVDQKTSVQVTINGSPTIINALTTCEPDRANFKASFSITGGQAPYTVNPVGTLSGTNPTNFVSGLIQSGTSQTFTVNDGNNCKVDMISVSKDCQCKTLSGDMRSDTTINVCENANIDATPYYQGGYFNDGNDTLMYYLHEGNSSVLINTLAKSHTPVFSFNSATMVYNKKYYISAVAGNALANFDIDEADPCLSVSAGLGVVFIELPSATVSITGKNPTCPAELSTLGLSFGTNNGPFELNYTEDGVAKNIKQVDATNNTININPIDTTDYIFIDITDKFGCMNSLANQTVTLNVNKSARGVLSAGASLCSDGGANLGKLMVTLTGTAPFTVVYNNSFTNIPQTLTSNGSVLNFSPTEFDPNTAIVFTLDTVSDATGSVCNSVVSGTATISPIPTAQISGDSIYCSGQSIDFNVTLTGIGPWDLKYTVDNGSPVSLTIPAGVRSSTQRITNPGLAAGIHNINLSAVVDNGTANACSGTVSGNAQVTINQAPTLLSQIVDEFTNMVVPFNPNDTICEGTTRKAKFTISGAGSAFTINYTLNGVANTLNLAKNADLITLPGAAGNYTFSNFIITDTTTAACKANGNSFSLFVNKNPTFDFDIPVKTICSGSPVNLVFTTSGNRNLTIEVEESSSAGTSSKFFNTAEVRSPETLSTTPPAGITGLVSYKLIEIKDGSNPICSAKKNKKIDITINESPTAAMNTPLIEVCQGSPVTLAYSFTGANGALIRGVYTETGTNVKDSVQSGTASKTIANLAPGVYNYTFSRVYEVNAPGCVGTSSGTTKVTVRPTPVVSIAVDKNIVCFNEPYTLTITPKAGGNAPYSYRYRTANGVDTTINNLTNPLNITYIGLQSGSFSSTSFSDNTTTNPGGLRCLATGLPTLPITVNPLPTGAISGANDICAGTNGTIEFTLNGKAPFTVDYEDDKGNSYTLSNAVAGINTVSNLNPNSTRTYTIKANGISDGNSPKQCTNSGSGNATITVHPIPVPAFSVSKPNGCSPVITTFTNTTPAIYTPTQAAWDLGNNSSSTNLDSVGISYVNTGNYTVSLTIVSQFGCVGTTTKNAVSVYPDPVADFFIDPTVLYVSNPTAFFRNLSVDAAQFNWSFGTGALSKAFEPKFNYPAIEDKEYQVCLGVTSAFGCVDTSCKTIKVLGEVLVFIPSSFTPNGDNINETWKPELAGLRLDMYDLKIFNRWGELIFETKDVNSGWDGMLKGTGQLAPDGIYIYKITGKSRYDASKFDYAGKINLMK